MARRRFLTRVTLAMMAAIGAVLSVPLLAYLLSPLFDPRRAGWREVGAVGGFPVGDTILVAFEDPSPLAWAGQAAKTAAWVRREAETSFTVFAINCTHLGCPVNWQPDAQLFLCPCHGGVFYSDGSVAGGPPPRPMIRYPTRIQDGRLQIFTRPFALA